MSFIDKIKDAIHLIEKYTLAFIAWTDAEFKKLEDFIAGCLGDKDASIIAKELVAEFKQLKADLIAENTKAVLDDVIDMVVTLSKLHDAKEGLDTVIQLLRQLSSDYAVLLASKKELTGAVI
jgi:hypothetical protein